MKMTYAIYEVDGEILEVFEEQLQLFKEMNCYVFEDNLITAINRSNEIRTSMIKTDFEITIDYLESKIKN